MGLDWREIGWHGGKAAVRRPRVRRNCWLASNPRMTIIRALSSLTRKKDQRELPPRYGSHAANFSSRRLNI